MSVWIPEEDYDWLTQFLDKVSAGDSFAEQFRAFRIWLKKVETSGKLLNEFTIAQRLQEISQKKVQAQQRARGKAPYERVCDVCRTRYNRDYLRCKELNRKEARALMCVLD